MSPEQVAGRRLGPGSDIFSLGSILYECLTGRAAFEGESLAATIARIETARVASLAEARPDLPGEVARLVDSLLALRPEARPSTALIAAREMEKSLRRLSPERAAAA